ncbi:MAG: GtrA family protein [Propionibacteriaceae bacterium]|nr:GtrA family protein [Propionibacteriaceae bacterium]
MTAPLPAQFLRFGIVGATGVVVNAVVMLLMHQLHGGAERAGAPLWNLPGTDYWVRYRNLVFLVSFLVANLWNYQANRCWTFKALAAARRPWWSGLWRFLAVGAAGAAIGLAVQIALSHPGSPLFLPDPWFVPTGGWRSRELWAHLFGVLAGLPVNFLVNRLWTFRHRPARTPLTPQT